MLRNAFSRGSVLLLMVLLVLVSSSRAVVYTRCQLARALYRTYGIPKSQLADWVCLAVAESSLNTGAVGPANSNGSRDYGLFQINSFYWCSGGQGSRHNECKLSCSALTNSDIGDDVKCAKFIFGRHGFSAWYGWSSKCKGKNLSPFLVGCSL